MNSKTKRRDWQVSVLIDEAQEYSDPQGQAPAPPRIDRDAADEEELERTRQPDWLQPVEHGGDLGEPQQENSVEVPLIDDVCNVPDPSAQDQSEIAASGTDALAYYAPFHFYHRTNWGIYIRDYGVAHLASEFLGRRRLTPSDNWALRCAYWLLYEHEYFHFQTELAATRYEALTRDIEIYKRLFDDRHASWLEESMANATAHSQLQQHEDGMLTFSRIQHFKGFASSWMKTQPKGYRDYDRWCRNSKTMQKGRSALTSKIHDNSRYGSLRYVSSEVLRPYENADYSRIPVVRVHDSRIPWLRSARLFPKANGVQVMVHTHEHPPPHIHAEFLKSNNVVRIEWPSLSPLRGEPALSAREEKNLRLYLEDYQDDILEKLRKVYPDEPRLQRPNPT